MGQLMWYTTKVGPDVENAARYLDVHMSHPESEHWKALGSLIGYLKVKNKKSIIFRTLKVIKAVTFCDSNYATNKETRNIFSVIVPTLGGTLLICSL